MTRASRSRQLTLYILALVQYKDRKRSTNHLSLTLTLIVTRCLTRCVHQLTLTQEEFLYSELP